jgi:hypothetical protein
MIKKESKLSELAKKAAKIKIVKRLDGIENAPFFKEKMEKAAKLLAVAGLPKH